jgi:flagellar basal-body rod protein FlgC
MSGLDSLFRGMRITATGMSAERTRVDTIAENIANARTTRTPDGGPYRRKLVVFEPLLKSGPNGQAMSMGVRASQIIEDDQTPFEVVFEPGHPDADAEGLVEYPNVNATREMADLITALRAYEANLSAEEALERMAERALEIAR